MDFLDEQLRRLEQGIASPDSTNQTQQISPGQDFSTRAERRTSAFNLDHIEESKIVRVITLLQSVLVEHCRWRATSPGNVLDRQVKATQTGTKPGITTGVVHIVYPVMGCLHSRAFLVGCAAIILYLLLTTVFTIYGLSEYGVARFASYQVRIDTSTPTDAAGASFHLLRRGCTVASANITATPLSAPSSSSAAVFTPAGGLPLPLEADGFALTLHGPAGIARAVFLGSNDGGQTWHVAGRSDFRRVPEGIRPLDGAAGGAKELRVDHGVRWPLVADSVAASLLLAGGFVGIAIFAALGRPGWSRTVATFACALVSLTRLTAGVGFVCGGLPRDAFSPLVHCAIFAAACAALLLPEFKFPVALVALGGASLATRIIQDAAIFGDAGYLAASPPYCQIVAVLVGLGLLARRYRFLRASLYGVAEDAERYDARWRRLMDGPAANLALLAKTTDDIAAKAAQDDGTSCPPPVRQLQRATSAPGPGDGCNPMPIAAIPLFRAGIRREESYDWQSVAGAGDPSAPAGSLDQLYSQAAGASPLLREVCGAWAAANTGVLDSADQRGVAAAARTGYGMVSAEMFRYLKDPARAVEKAVSCYGGDSSRLTDVCRCRIMFDRVADLTSCVEMARADASVEIVRARNGMQPGSDASGTGGFRAVVLSVRLKGDDACLLGIEMHVCEVQLLLAALLDLQELAQNRTNGTHARFLAFRASRTMLGAGGWPLGWLFPLTVAGMGASRRKEAQNGMSVTTPYAFVDALHDSVGSAGDNLESSVVSHAPMPMQPSAQLGRFDNVIFENSDAEASSEAALVHSIAPLPVSNGERVGGQDGVVGSGSNGVGPAFLDARWEAAAGWRGSQLQCDDIALKGNLVLGKAVLRTYLRSTMMPGGYLDLDATYVEKALRQSDSSSSFHTSEPISAAMSKKKYQVLALLFAGYFAYLGFLAIQTALRGGIQFRSRMLRLTAVGLRNPDILANYTSISSLGLLKDGCRVYPPAVATLKLANAHYAVFDRELEANGFYFETSSTSPDYDPIKWYAQTSLNNGTSWVAIASSVMLINRDGSITFSITLPYPTPQTRKTSISIDLRTTWEWVLCWIGATVFTLLEYLLIGLAGITGREGSAKMLWLIMNSWATIFLGITAIGYHTEGSDLDATYQWLNVIPSLALTLGIGFFEERYALVVGAYGVIRAVASAIQSMVLYKKPWILFATQDFALSTSPLTALFVIIVLINRKRIMFQSRKLIIPDMKLYNTVWETVAGGNTDSLMLLKAQVLQLTKTCSKSAPRQTVHKVIDVSGQDANQNGVCTCLGALARCLPWAQASFSLLDSIDQVFVQAACLHPLLLAKVKTWALVSDGCFPVLFERTRSYTAYAEVQDSEDVEIKYGKLKSSSRSIEKLARSYAMDVSRLVDVCRQTVVFKKVEGITACLSSIAADPEVRILRIKNRLDPAFDARRSAGYRDVAMNLQIVSAQTKELGIDTHVCELQLMLQEVAELKSNEGHKRYVTFRNLRGE